MRLLLLAVLTAAACLAGITRDIEFARPGGTPLTLDAYVPEGAGPFAAVVLVHGGGWRAGDKRRFINPWFPLMTDAGFAWFSVDYRLAPAHKFPAAVEDVEEAVRWVRDNAARFHVDSAKIAIMGESAGGHIVAMVAVRGQAPLAAVVDFYGVHDFPRIVAGLPNLKDVVTAFTGDSESSQKEASPINFVSKQMPPLLLFHGTGDKTVPYEQSPLFCDKVKAAGARCELVTVPNAPHGVEPWEKNPSWLGYKDKVVEWLRATLRVVPPADGRTTALPGTNTHFYMPAYSTREQWEARKSALRKQILSAAGLYPMPPKTPLNARVFGRIDHADYSVEKVALETFPGYYLGGNLYRPRGRSGKFPGVASPHGHWNYGRLEDTPLGSIPARGINLARQGYVVFTYDMVGYNDTVQTPHEFGNTPREQLWAFGPLGLQLWNSIRVVDFLESLPDVDAGKLAATGASGGGTQTFLLTAVDERVKYSAPVNMVSSIMQGGSPCENAPNLRLEAFNVEFAAMMAPRPMLLVSATGDWTKNLPREEFPAIRGIYELYDQAAQVEAVQIDAPHNYNEASREAVYKFFGARILNDADETHFREKPYRPEKLQDALVWHGQALPANARSFEQLFGDWRNMSRSQHGDEKERLRLALAVEWPSDVLVEGSGEQVSLGRPNGKDRVTAIWIPGKGAPAVIVHPDGANAARATEEARRRIAEGRPVLLLNAFAARRDQSERHFLTFNRTDDQNRVQDILTALAFAARQGAPELVGIGKAGVWCTFAAAVAPRPLRLSAADGSFRGGDEEFAASFFVPGIQRAGGWEAALTLTRESRDN